MKSKYTILFCSVLVATVQIQARTSSGQFLSEGFGAKSVGLGNAYGVVVSDPSAVYWNPAGLAQIYSEKKITQKVEAPKDIDKSGGGGDDDFNKLLGEQNTSGGAANEKVEITEPVFQFQSNSSAAMLSQGRLLYFTGVGISAFGGGLAAGGAGTRVMGVQNYNTQGISTGESIYNSHAGFLGYGWGRGPVRLGVSGMGLREEIGPGAVVNGGGLNVGAQVVVLPSLVSVAADLKNLAAVQSRTGGGLYDIAKLDTRFSFSIQVQAPPPNANFKLLLGFTSNLDDLKGDGTRLNMGLAYGFNKYFYAMAGISGSRPAVGLGIKIAKFFEMSVSANRDPLGRGFQYFGELNFTF